MESSAPPPYYGEFQQRGRKIQDWIDNPAAECHIKPNTLTYDQLNAWARVVETFHDRPEISNVMSAEGDEGPTIPGPWTAHSFEHAVLAPDGTCKGVDSWESQVTAGIILILVTFRESGPYISQIAQACYERQYPISTLKHVVVSDVINDNTLDFLTSSIFTGVGSMMDSLPKTFTYGTAEYEAILGTRCGSVMGYLVLGAFERGTRRISRITIFCPKGAGIFLQFDIEELNPVSSPSTRGSKRRRGNGEESDDEDEEEEKQRKKQRRSPQRPPQSYDGPAKRTRQTTGAVNYTITPQGRLRKP